MYKGKENLVYPHLADLVTIAEWKYPFPSRTRKSSTLAPMILLNCGKVGSRQVFFYFPARYAVACVVIALAVCKKHYRSLIPRIRLAFRTAKLIPVCFVVALGLYL